MREILITKDVPYGTSKDGGIIGGAAAGGILPGAENELDRLSAGAFVLVNDRNKVIDLATTIAAGNMTDKFYIAVGRADDDAGSKICQLFARGSAELDTSAFVAPVAQELQVGHDLTLAAGSLGLPATLIAGDSAFIRITNDSLGTLPPVDSFRFEEVVTAIDTDVTLMTRLVARFNADALAGITASVTGATGATLGMHLVSNDANVHFSVGVTELIGDATITKDGTGTSVLQVNGTGTSAQVATIEDEFSPEEGNTNKTWLTSQYYPAPFVTVAGETYDLYSITWTQLKQRAITPAFASDQLIQLAIPTAFVTTNLDARLAEIIL